MSGAAERERERSFVVLGFLESDALEAAESTLLSESARLGGWSAASMTVVLAFRRKRACGRGWRGDGRELAVAAVSTQTPRLALPDGNRHTSRHVVTRVILSAIMSILDAGELANTTREWLLTRMRNSYELSAPERGVIAKVAANLRCLVILQHSAELYHAQANPADIWQRPSYTTFGVPCNAARRQYH